MENPHIESILHLSALALIVAIAYLGLDRVHQEKDNFLEALDRAKAKATAFVLQCDVERTVPAEAMFNRFPFLVRLKFYALCQIAGVNGNIEMGFWGRVSHLCHRQRHVPLLGYFRRRQDRTWISIFALLLLVIFLYMTAAALWKLTHFPTDLWWFAKWIETKELLTPSYWACMAILLWIFFTVGMTHLLGGIETSCDRLQKAVDDHMKAAAADFTRKSLREGGGNGAAA